MFPIRWKAALACLALVPLAAAAQAPGPRAPSR